MVSASCGRLYDNRSYKADVVVRESQPYCSQWFGEAGGNRQQKDFKMERLLAKQEENREENGARVKKKE